MVGSHLHHAFRSWFKETEKDGTPLLPVHLSKKYTVLPQVLGQGSFAVVKAVAEKATGEQRALKIIAKKPLKDDNEEMLKEEITILGKVHHPNIIKMWDLYETKEAVFIVTDLCRGGELFDRLVEKVHYNELDARHSMRQIMDGVAYLHDHDIIHRDLKPENILLRDRSESSDVVISDFGLSRFIPDEGLLMTACGSPQYVSPEVLLGKGYNAAVDIWSCGVIAFALLGGYTPFYGENQPTLFKRIIEMEVEFEPEYWSEVSNTAKDFILRCLCAADKRMTAKEALAHPWLDQLPPLHEESARGCCLKDGARKMTNMRKLRKAVTAIEALNHLNRLHTLRQQHSDVLPHEQHSLRSIASRLELQNSQHIPPEMAMSKPGKKPSGDSAMSLDLVVMMAMLPNEQHTNNNDGNANTEAVADAVESTLNRGRESSSQNKSAGNGSSTPLTSESGTSARSGQSSGSSSQQRRPSRSLKKDDSESTKTLNSLLDQYKKTELPSSARLDPHAKMREPAKMTFTNAWRYLPFLVQQGVSIGSAVASHAIYGPPKKSWGIEMSVFTRMLRDVAVHSEFASIAGLQQFFDLGALLPTPKDGLITPVTFRVKKRGLRGFLAEADAAEDGKREITAEWVVGKQTWRRLQSEWRGGKQKGKERVILYIHGGAYFIMSAATHRPLTISLSKYTECRVFGINYRLAPGTKFPGALHDCVASWFRLTDDLGIPPSNIVLGADSAGGGLALALMYYLRDNKYDLPSGAMLFSPWVDLTMSCDSWETNAAFDYLPMPISGDHMNPVAAYLGDNIDKYLTHPYASPLFGDMHGLPPLLIQCGDAEVLRDEVTLLAHKASLSGVAVRHELYEDCVHVFQAFLFLDASRKALQSARHFVRTALDKRGKSTPSISKTAKSALNKEMGDSSMRTPEGDAADPTTGESKNDVKPSPVKKVDSSESSTSTDKIDGGIDEIATLPHTSTDGTVSGDADDPEEDTSLSANEEDWELERNAEDESLGGGESVEGKFASLPSKVAQNMLGTDNEAVTETTDEGKEAAQDTERKHPEQDGQNQQKPSFASMTIEEAQERGQAAMQQQLSSNAPALSKFHAPQKPLTPRMRRTGSEKQLTGLLKSFEESNKSGSSSLKTNVWTPSSAQDE